MTGVGEGDDLSPEPEMPPGAEMRQADVVLCAGIVLIDDGGASVKEPTPGGVVLLSQTCDLVRDYPPHVAVAPLVRLATAEARAAKDGQRPQFVPVPAAGHDAFADLGRIGSVSKTHMAQLSRRRGVTSEEEASKFGKLVGRRFSRFPFPDDIVAWLDPLRKLAESKHGKSASPEGKLFSEVVELRLEVAGPWHQPPYDLTLAIILRAGAFEIPGGDDPADIPVELAQWLRTNDRLRPVTELAERLEQAKDAEERYWLWSAVGEAWAAKCQPTKQSLRVYTEDRQQEILAVINSIVADVTTEDEYSLYRYRRSEMLDLDYLSPPALVHLPHVTPGTESANPVSSPPTNPDAAPISQTGLDRVESWVKETLRRIWPF